MTTVATYRDLVAWQRSMDFACEVYAVSARLPERERYGLAAQMQRSAVSVPSNIAEGAARLHTGDYQRHLSIALGSLAECETQLMLAVRAGLVAPQDIERAWDLAQDSGRLIRRLHQSLERRRSNTSHQSLVTSHL